MKKTLQAILKNRFQKNLAANFLPQKNKTSTNKTNNPQLIGFKNSLIKISLTTFFILNLISSIPLFAVAEDAKQITGDKTSSTGSEITFGWTTNLGMLPLIAKEEGFFKENNVSVTFKKLQTGKMAMDSIISGEIDFGTIVDSNVSFINYSKNPLKVIAIIGTKEDDTIYFKSTVAKPDTDKNESTKTEAKDTNIIKTPRDLIGKKIGYVPATTSHIFLARFLDKHQIKWSEIKPVILQPGATVAALEKNRVDAVSIWQP